MTDVCGWLIVRVGVVLRGTVVGCDWRLWLVHRPSWCSPEKDCTVVGCDWRLWLVYRPGWCSPEKDCCWLWLTFVVGLSSGLVQSWDGLLLVMTDVCGWLIVRAGAVLRGTVVGCDWRLWLVDRPGWCSHERDCCWLWLTFFWLVDRPSWCSPEKDCCWMWLTFVVGWSSGLV